VGGVVLAADNTWFADLPFDIATTDWWSNVTPVEVPTADIAIAPDPASHRAPELSIDRLRHGVLFSRPSTSWRLDPAATGYTSTWMTQPSIENFYPVITTSDYSRSSLSPGNFIASAAATSANAPTLPTALTATGTWTATTSGNWGIAGNWSGGVIADGAGNTANFNAADLTADITVTLDSSRTIGNLFIGDTNTTNSYTIAPSGGSALTFDSGNASNAAILQQTSPSAGDTIQANLFFKNDAFNINNLSTTKPFTISGDIASSQTNGFPTVSFNTSVATPGEIRVTGKITNGSTGSRVSVEVDGGTVVFSGANDYTGSTFVSGGTLLINGNQSNATGLVQVAGSGSVLGGTGTVGGTVFMFGGTITGGTTTSVSTLTMTNNLNMDTHEGAGGTYLANISGTTSDLLAITGTLTLGPNSSLIVDGTLDGVTTYTIATFSLLAGNAHFGSTSGIPGNYMIVYDPGDIELVPTAIPEPATWIGAVLALGAVAFARRRKLRAHLL
jgi:autotransporter-associated beta strand protein